MASREELVELRKKLVERVERLRRTGDYGAGAADIRENAETLLVLIEDRLESKPLDQKR